MRHRMRCHEWPEGQRRKVDGAMRVTLDVMSLCDRLTRGHQSLLRLWGYALQQLYARHPAQE